MNTEPRKPSIKDLQYPPYIFIDKDDGEVFDINVVKMLTGNDTFFVREGAPSPESDVERMDQAQSTILTTNS